MNLRLCPIDACIHVYVYRTGKKRSKQAREKWKIKKKTNIHSQNDRIVKSNRRNNTTLDPYSEPNKPTMSVCKTEILWSLLSLCRHVFAWDSAAFQLVHFASIDSVIRELWNYSNRSVTVSTIIRANILSFAFSNAHFHWLTQSQSFLLFWFSTIFRVVLTTDLMLFIYFSFCFAPYCLRALF